MRFWIVDTFSSSLFEGNTAVVCLLERDVAAPVLQKIAREFNAHETVFVSPVSGNNFQIKWFTPFSQESLCGHGLLAAAHVLWNEMSEISSDFANFDTPTGTIMVSKKDNKIVLRTRKKIDEPSASPDRLINALGIPPISVSKCEQIYIVEMFSVKQIMKLEPDISKLEKVPCNGVVVTAEYGNDVPYDFASRFFAPRMGINEDHATVWNHCLLGPYWSTRLGRSSFVAVQSLKRKSVISVECSGNYVNISGDCAVVASGSLRNVSDWTIN
ncbi:MAG: PhzF family phenazine biosynthesis protein [Holosporales bacterium]|jgi:PhzF family phenazine biosynthesis protein|nr:PhzF family phenazine biosynthesis protein [Holosporales bacterium]